MKSKELGSSGEKFAVRYLQKHQFLVHETGFRYNRGEIDIIASKNDTLIFIEVKTRRSHRYGRPEEYVTPEKQRQIRMVAGGYLIQKGLLYSSCRFDVLALSYDSKKGFEVRHIVNAF
ncbi:MAG: YraN family protein [Candidatus Aminicenantes bacterium]|nr:YraN family protein [Candidatus Aminicenantes bacterium]